MKLKPQTALIITLIIFVAGIAITSAAGLYSTQTTKTPGKIEAAGYADQNDPGDIRGSYTFSDISKLYNVPMAELSAAFSLGSGDAGMKISQLGSLYETASVEIGPASVKLFVAYYLGLPYEPSEEAWLPKSAADVLIGTGVLSPERRTYIEAHIIP